MKSDSTIYLLFIILLFIFFMALSFLFVSGLVYIVCWGFNLTFTWKLAFGVYAVILLLKMVFKKG